MGYFNWFGIIIQEKKRPHSSIGHGLSLNRLSNLMVDREVSFVGESC
uniref:Uncharacterized protein n=1 Tax=Arundo donax TaxID=35708 RepID=A0A0A9BLN1_ARUDO